MSISSSHSESSETKAKDRHVRDKLWDDLSWENPLWLRCLGSQSKTLSNLDLLFIFWVAQSS